MALVLEAVEFFLLEQFLDFEREVLRHYLDLELLLEQHLEKELILIIVNNNWRNSDIFLFKDKISNLILPANSTS